MSTAPATAARWCDLRTTLPPPSGLTPLCPVCPTPQVPQHMVPPSRRHPRMPLKQFALAVGGLCALACVASTLLLVVAVGSGGAAVASVGPVCATYGPLDGLSAVQAENARTIAAVAIGRGGEQAALVALTAAIAESNLLSLGNAKVPEAA